MTHRVVRTNLLLGDLMLKLVSLIMLTVTTIGCGRIEISDSTHRVEGDATVHVIIGIDVSACDSFPIEQRPKCVSDLIELFKVMQEAKGAAE